MTFEDGNQTGVSTQAQITESLIKLIAVLAISLAIVGAYLIAVMQDNAAAAASLQPLIAIVMALWFGQGAISTYASVKREQIKAAAATGEKKE